MANVMKIKEICEKYNVEYIPIRNAVYYTKKLKKADCSKPRNVFIEENDFLEWWNFYKGSQVTSEEIEKWYEDYLLGVNLKKLAQKYDRCQFVISRELKNRYGNIDFNSYHLKHSSDDIQEMDRIYKIYTESGKSLIAACRESYLPSHKIINYFKRRGLRIKTLSEVHSFVTNPDFFSLINSEIKAYLLGFFAADGHIERRKDYDSYTLRVGVQLDDMHILKLYNKYICNNQIAISCLKENLATIAITSKQIGEDLLKLGFDNNKTYTWAKLPDIPNDLFCHFLRGWFDGDGSIMLNRRRANKRPSGFNRKFAIANYNSPILEELLQKLQELGVHIKNYNIRHISKENFKIRNSEVTQASGYLLEIFDIESLTNLYNFLYSTATFYFKRKKDKFSLAILNNEDIDAALQGNL